MSPNAHRPTVTHRQRVPEVQFEISDFGFEITSLSNFEIPDFLIPDFSFPIPSLP
jgi:hypothetical protein